MRFALVYPKGTKARKVVNIEQLTKRLQEVYPIVEFVLLAESSLSEWTLAQYAEMFCNARGLIGGHGAGLTNMFWLPPSNEHRKTFLVEIIREGQLGRVYGTMARNLGFSYVDTTSTTIAVGNATYMHYADTMVDVHQTEILIRPLLRLAGFEPM